MSYTLVSPSSPSLSKAEEADVVEGRLESAETDFRGARETLLLDAQEVRIAGYLGTVALGAVQRGKIELPNRRLAVLAALAAQLRGG